MAYVVLRRVRTTRARQKTSDKLIGHWAEHDDMKSEEPERTMSCSPKKCVQDTR